MTGYLVLAGLAIACVMGWRLINAGGDGNKAKVAEANLAKAQEAAKPVTDAERADVIKLFQRN